MARISELHYSNAYAANSGVSEFLEVSLNASEDPAETSRCLSTKAMALSGFEIPLTSVPAISVTVDPDNNEVVYVISADDFPILLTDPNGGGANNYEAYALTNTSTGEVIDFYDIGGGTQNIVAQDGLAAGETSVNLPVLVSPNQTTTTLQFNQPNPDTLTYGTLSPGDSGAPCFTAGTQVETPDGPRRIETLCPGDMVLTVDDGACPVRWIGERRAIGRDRFAPIRISAGTFGAKSDILVSPQHRILISGWQAELMFGESEILVPAKALVNETTVSNAPCEIVRYVHLLFDRHQLITTEGLISESFFPAQEGLLGLGSDTAGSVMDDLKAKYLGQIAEAGDENALEAIRVAAVGKKGEVALKMRELGKMTPEERQVAGPALNALKDEINSALSAKKAALADAALDERLRTEWLDVTLPTRARRQGSIHPVSQATEELTAIFAELGFLRGRRAADRRPTGTISTR